MSNPPPAVLDTDLVYGSEFVPVITSGSGSALYDIEGRRYLDFESCNGAALLGYSPDLRDSGRSESLVAAPSFVETDRRRELASRLGSMAPRDVDGGSWRVGFETTGAGGIELALRVAAHSVQNPRLFVLAGAYHGRSVFLSGLSSSQRYRTASHWTSDDKVTRLPVFEDEDPDEEVKLQIALNYLTEDTWGGGRGEYRERGVTPIFLFEPYQNVGGGIKPNRRLIREIVSEIRRRGGLVIVDETFTGVYRTGRLWGFEHFDIVPEIFVGAKALANGIAPISCVWVQEKVRQSGNIGPGMHSSTFASNVLVLDTVARVLDLHDSLGSDYLIEAAITTGDRLGDIGASLYANSSLVVNASVHGAVLRINLREPCAASLRSWLIRQGQPGVMVASTGLSKDTLLLYPPITTEPADFEEVGKSLLKSIEQYSNEIEHVSRELR